MPTRRKDSGKGTALQKTYWREADAREVLDLWRRSGKNLSAFAQAHGLCRNRLARWRDRLGEEAITPQFHEVRLLGPVDRVASTDEPAGGIEIVVSGGRRVVVRSGFDPALLAEVVQALEAIAC